MAITLRVENFRSIAEATLNIDSGLNVLVGSNGSGKTNLLSALKFVSNVTTYGAALAMGKAGGPARNFRRGTREIRFVMVGDYETTRYKKHQVNFFLRWELVVAQGTEGLIQVSHESMRVLADLGGDEVDQVILVEVNRTPSGAAKSRVWFAEESELTKRLVDLPGAVIGATRKAELFRKAKERLTESLKDLKKHPADASLFEYFAELHRSARQMLRTISSLDEYNIQPDVARQASDPLPIIRMGNDGGGVSEVIHALESHQFKRFATRPFYAGSRWVFGAPQYDYAFVSSLSKKNPLAEITEHVRAGVASIDEIGTEIDPSTGRRYVVFRCGEHSFRPEEVSDGTMKWLCLLVALYVPRSRVVLLEEPENFMHPWMQQRFVALAREQAKKNGSTVVLTTHSVTVLNALQIDELQLVHRMDGSTRIESVPDREAVQKLLDSSNFGLGDVWVSGGIGGVTGVQ